MQEKNVRGEDGEDVSLLGKGRGLFEENESKEGNYILNNSQQIDRDHVKNTLQKDENNLETRTAFLKAVNPLHPLLTSLVSPVSQILGTYVSFDLEWNPITGEIEAAAFIDNNGKSEVYLQEWFSSERDLLIHILAYLIDYENSIGWYTTGTRKYQDGVDSDLIHLHNRCEANGIESIVDFRRNHQPFIPGLIHIDLYQVFDKKIIKEAIYKNVYRTLKLNAVSKYILKEGKYKNLTGAQFNSLSIEEKRRYVLKDAELVMKLSKHENFKILDIMFAISELCEIDFERVCRTNLTTWWKSVYDSMIENGECGNPTKVFKRKGYAAENDSDEQLESIVEWKYKGADVFKPKKGLYDRFLVVLDAKSLYPSVAILYNLSFDTINCDCCKENLECRIREPEILKDCKIEKEYWICKLKDGATRKKFIVFREERFRQQKEGNESKQIALKTLINAAYGVFANPYFAYYDPRVAELITAYGRFTLLKMSQLAEKMGFEVIYGDTDSVLIQMLPNNEDNNDILQIAKDTAFQFQNKCKKELGVGIDLKRIYFRSIVSEGKKHYLGFGIDDKGKEVFDIIGMEGKKSNRPKFIHKVFNKIATKIVKAAVIDEEAVSIARSAMQELDSGKVDPSELIRGEVLQLNPEDYKDQSSAICKKGHALNLRKGDLAEWYDSNDKAGWSQSAKDISIQKYKQLLWNSLQEIFEIIGFPIEELAKEFGVTNKKNKRNKEDGHNAERPRRVTGLSNLQEEVTQK